MPPALPLLHCGSTDLLVDGQHLAREPLGAVAERVRGDAVRGPDDGLPPVLTQQAQHPGARRPLGVEHQGVVVERHEVGVDVHGGEVVRKVNEVHTNAALIEVAAEPLVALAVGGEGVEDEPGG